MDKLTKSIPQIRVSEKTKEGIKELATLSKRDETSFVRMVMESITEEYEKTKYRDRKSILVRFYLF